MIDTRLVISPSLGLREYVDRICGRVVGRFSILRVCTERFDGYVHSFLVNSPEGTDTCFAWSTAGPDGQLRFQAFRKTKEIDSPEQAVRIAMA
jgi:hypothetical protein